MKTFILWGALALAPVGFIAPVCAQSNLVKAPVKWPTIRGGYSGDSFNERVAAIQYLLRARGFYKGRADGIFGSKTITAVKAFQRKNKLFVDGVAGPRTLPKLVIVVKRGSKGDAVRASQILVRGIMGHNGETPNLGLEADGVFSDETQNAIELAQEFENDMETHLRVDGIMNARSWCLLLGGTVVGSSV